MKTSAIRVPARRLILFAATLMLLFGFASFTSLLSDASAETNDSRPVETKIQDQVDVCGADGGALVVTDWTFDAGGNVAAVTTECFGGERDGTVCILTPNAGGCAQSLTRTPEPIAPGAGDTADPGENPSGDSAVPESRTAPMPGVAEEPARGEEITMTIAASPVQQVLACGGLGGIGTIVANGSAAAVEVQCVGGLLDGMTCVEDQGGSSCAYVRVTTDPALLARLSPDSLPDLIEDPTWDGNVVVFNESGAPVGAAATQNAMCTMFGGSGKIVVGDIFIGESTFTCHGGLLDGLFCTDFVNPDQGICVFLATAPEGPPVSTAGEVENPPVERQPSNGETTVDPTPTMEPTVEPTLEPMMMPTDVPAVEPTAMPTDAPLEPTVAPTWSPPNNDNAAPPNNGVEPIVDPTPTPLILL